MAAITSAASGAWSSTGTWTGGTIPGNGDTVTIQSGHAVTVSDARTVGHSPGAGDATAAILVNSTGTLSINAGGTLTVRGDIKLNNTTLTLNCSGGVPTLEFDASQAGTPSTARYVCQIGTNASDPNAKVLVTNGGANRAIIRSNASGANARFTHNGNDQSGQVDIDYCDLLRIGDSANLAFNFILAGGQIFSIQHSTLDACGQIGNQAGVAVANTAILRLNGVTMRNSVGSNSVGFPANAVSGAGVRELINCVFDKSVVLYNITGYVITGTLFQSGWDYTGGPWSTFSNNLIALPEAHGGDLLVPGSVENTYFLRVGAPDNPHYFLTEDLTRRITGCVFEQPDGTNGAGDCIAFNAPSAARTIMVDHNLVLFSGSDVNAGTLLSCLGGANLTVICEHNTYHGGQGIYIGETYAGHAGMLRSCKSNLAYSQTTNTAYIVSGDAGTTINTMRAGAATFNGVWNPISTDGYDNEITYSPGSPGVKDVSGDPNFVDITRNIKTWDTSLGGAGTLANALTELGKRNDGTGYNSAYTILALLAYVKAGFYPTNPAFNAAHDHESPIAPSYGWIGALGRRLPKVSYANFPVPMLRQQGVR